MNAETALWRSMQTLHGMGPSQVIVSSIPAVKTGGEGSTWRMYASSNAGDGHCQTFRIEFPYLKGCFTGTGDSFSALVLAWLHKDQNLVVGRTHFICPIYDVCSSPDRL